MKHISKWRKINVVLDGQDPISFELDEHAKLKKKIRRQIPRDLTKELKKIPKKDAAINQSFDNSFPITNAANLQVSSLDVPNNYSMLDHVSAFQTETSSGFSTDQNDSFEFSIFQDIISSEDYGGLDCFGDLPFDIDESNSIDF